MRQQPLADYIGCGISELKADQHKENLFEYEKISYLILTDEEATKEAKQKINDSLGTLNASLIKMYLKTDIDVEVIEHIQGEMCPNCTFLLLSLVENLDKFYKEVIKRFGRGYFIATYDHKEHITFDFNENKCYYIYRSR